jgi:hypothetical protein
MTVQILRTHVFPCSLFSVQEYELPIHQEPIRYSASEIGYEIDEEELAREILALSVVELQDGSCPDTAPESFEREYLWFLS